MTLNYDQYPEEFVAYEDHDEYGDILPAKTPKAGKSAKQGKTGKDPSSKVKKPVVPVVPHYEGWVITVLDADQPGETSSWIKTRKTLLPVSSKDLYRQAVEQGKLSGSVSRQFQKLGANQQTIVNRLVAEKNSEEKQSNAEWSLFSVKKLYYEQKTTFRSNKINNAMRVTMLRQEKAQDVAAPTLTKGVAIDDNDIIDLSKPVVKPTKKDASAKAGKDGDKKATSDKKKANKKEQPAQDMYEQWAEHAQQPDPFPQQQDCFPQYQQHQDHFQQHQHPQDQYQQQHDRFPQHHHHQQQQQPYPQQEQPPYVDPYNMQGMNGTLPHDDGRIPIPVHEYPPEAPMPPQHSHQQPFQPFPGVPQADPMADPRRQDHSAFGTPQFSARQRSRSRTHQEPEREPRHGSHSRPRQEPEREPRRDSVGKDARKIGEILKTSLRGEFRDVMREVAAEDKVLRHWPAAGGSYPPTTSSSQSTRQDDMWSRSPSSDGRQHYGHSTPGTSPDRGERVYLSRPTGSLHRQGSSGYGGSQRPDGRRIYQERGYDVKPHDSHRDRYRDDGRGRSPRYIREHREVVDDYPDAPYHRQQQRKEPRISVEQRPRVQRRVTDLPSSLPTAEFSRRPRNEVDYTDRLVYEDHGDRRSGRRDRQPQRHYL